MKTSTQAKASRQAEATTARPGRAKPSTDKSTKERLLDAAEVLFARDGIHATSLREITSHAQANLASVNYHFSSKEALAEAVFERRLGPLNAERIRLLSAAEEASAPRPITLEALLHAFLDPTAALWNVAPEFMTLLGRLQFEPDKNLHRFYLSQFDEVLRRFTTAMGRVAPGIPPHEILWRGYFIVGAMVYSWTCHADLDHLSGGLCKIEPYGQLIERLVAFGAAGLRSAAVCPESKA